MVPEFRRLWLVGMATSVARWLEMVVIGVVVFQQTGSALLVAAMTLLRIAPLGLFGAVAGVLADWVPRRRALAGILVMQGSAVAILALLFFAEMLSVWHVGLACAVSGLGWAADNPVRRMMIGDAVGPRRVGSAMSFDVLGNNASRIIGPALGGTVLALFGQGFAFGLAALIYLIALGAALRLTGGRAAASRRVPLGQELRQGFAAARDQPRLRGVMVVTMLFNIFAWPCTSMVPVIGSASLDLGPSGIGVLASMDGIGAFVILLGLGMLSRPSMFPALHVGGCGVYFLAQIGFALAPDPVSAGVVLLIGGIGWAGFASTQATLIYLVVEPEMRTRAFGVLTTAVGTGLLGFVLLGALSEWFGAVVAVLLVAGTGFAALVATARLWLPLFRTA